MSHFAKTTWYSSLLILNLSSSSGLVTLTNWPLFPHGDSSLYPLKDG